MLVLIMSVRRARAGGATPHAEDTRAHPPYPRWVDQLICRSVVASVLLLLLRLGSRKGGSGPSRVAAIGSITPLRVRWETGRRGRIVGGPRASGGRSTVAVAK